MNIKEEVIAEAILKRFVDTRLPRLQAIKESVDNGERLSDYDLTFMKEVLDDASLIHAKIEAHPEYQELATKAIELYHHITEAALKNEKA
ncbi:hypothetical protein [Agaribacterium sp. ZY112]|uniref:hypothetical protein n=1 Tax=Agaribacterium sp. ZY112 TaxID=3233574 RepID=UPI003524D008